MQLPVKYRYFSILRGKFQNLSVILTVRKCEVEQIARYNFTSAKSQDESTVNLTANNCFTIRKLYSQAAYSTAFKNTEIKRETNLTGKFFI